MLWRRKLWGVLALCLTVFLWNLYKSLYVGPSHSSHSLDEWPVIEEKPCNCNRCTEHSNLDWFCEHFDTSVNCLLTPKNPEVASGVLQWWLFRLQNIIHWSKHCCLANAVSSKPELWSDHGKLQRSQNGNQLQEIIKHLFDILSPAAGVNIITQCRTCAVVGNSGKLRGSKYGEKIDSHHFVLRMNRAQTAGFEEDVGARTTHHLIYPESAMNLPPGTHLVLVPFKPLDLKWLASAFSTGEIQHTYTRVKQFLEADKSKVLILNPAFLKYIQDKWTKHQGKYPSTGFIALIFAIHICTQVSVFGFGADSNGNWHHYWEVNRFAHAFHKTGVHNATVELGLIKRLATEGKVSFYQ